MTRRLPSTLAVALALGLAMWAWAFRTGAVGGSDSACYALMARMYAEGACQPRSVLAEEAPWPDPTRVAAPAGFLPSVTRRRGRGAGVCAGLLAAARAARPGAGPRCRAPRAGGGRRLLVWFAFVLARRLSTPAAGVAAAALVATTPIVLFQAVQPMNDITTGALWLGVAAAMCVPRPGAHRAARRHRRAGAPESGDRGRRGDRRCSLGRRRRRRHRPGARFVRALMTGGLMAAPGVAVAMAAELAASTGRRCKAATAIWASCSPPPTCRSTSLVTDGPGSPPARRWCCWRRWRGGSCHGASA